MKRFLTLLITLTAFQIFAQAPQIDESLKVNLVEFEVKPQTLGGKFLANLSASDFTIKENGVKQDIDSIEEIRLESLSPEEAAEYRSRIMLLLDIKNTSYQVVNNLFGELRNWVQTKYDGKSDIGISVYTNGIIEVVSFTRDLDELFDGIDKIQAFYKKNKWRSYAKKGTDNDGLSDRFIVNHNRHAFDIFGQFVRYIGAYSGKKNLVILSENWRAEQYGFESEKDIESRITVRDVQTVCMYQKVAINAISLAKASTIANFAQSGRTGNYFLEPSADLAGATSGIYTRVNFRELAKTLERTVNRANHYYRIRYYSQYDGENFRKINVSVKGIGRLANTLQGYYPKSREIMPDATKARISYNRDFEFDLAMKTQWLHWERDGWGKTRANYALSQKVYDANGELIHENVFFNEINRKKNEPQLELRERFNLNLPAGLEAHRIDTQITDLTTGRKVNLSQEIKS